MILPRQPCPTCGTKFTPESAAQTECGECHIWLGALDDWGSPEYRERDRAKAPRTADDKSRSLDNYRAVTGAQRRHRPPS